MDLDEDLKFLQKYALNMSRLADPEHKDILAAVLETILNGRNAPETFPKSPIEHVDGTEEKTSTDEGACGFGEATKEQRVFNRDGKKIWEKRNETFEEIHKNITKQARLLQKHENATKNNESEDVSRLALRSPRNGSCPIEKLVFTPTGLSAFVSTSLSERKSPRLTEIKQTTSMENNKNGVGNTRDTFNYRELLGVDPKTKDVKENCANSTFETLFSTKFHSNIPQRRTDSQQNQKNVNYEALGAIPKQKPSSSPTESFRTVPTWSDVELSSFGSIWYNTNDKYGSEHENNFVLNNLKTFSTSISDTSKLILENSSDLRNNREEIRTRKRTSKSSNKDNLETIKRRRKM